MSQQDNDNNEEEEEEQGGGLELQSLLLNDDDDIDDEEERIGACMVTTTTASVLLPPPPIRSHLIRADLSSMDPATTRLEARAFSNCVALRDITLWPHLQWIGERALERCHALVRITLPLRVQRIDAYAMANCSQLREIQFQSCSCCSNHDDTTNGSRSSSMDWLGLPWVREPRRLAATAFDNCRAIQLLSFPAVTTIRPTKHDSTPITMAPMDMIISPWEVWWLERLVVVVSTTTPSAAPQEPRHSYGRRRRKRRAGAGGWLLPPSPNHDHPHHYYNDDDDDDVDELMEQLWNPSRKRTMVFQFLQENAARLSLVRRQSNNNNINDKDDDDDDSIANTLQTMWRRRIRVRLQLVVMSMIRWVVSFGKFVRYSRTVRIWIGTMVVLLPLLIGTLLVGLAGSTLAEARDTALIAGVMGIFFGPFVVAFLYRFRYLLSPGDARYWS